MSVLTVLFPSASGASFDFDYAKRVHLPLVKRLWGHAGLEQITLLRGVQGGGGEEPSYLAMALLRFSSAENLQFALSNDDAKEIGLDIARFTDVKPVIQINLEVVGDGQASASLSQD